MDYKPEGNNLLSLEKEVPRLFIPIWFGRLTSLLSFENVFARSSTSENELSSA